METVIKVGQVINFKLKIPSLTSVSVCRRIQNGGRTKNIIVKFIHRFDKKAILRKKDLSLSNLQVMDSLIDVSSRRRLLATAREARQKAFVFIWTKNGRIMVRKGDGEPVIVINIRRVVNCINIFYITTCKSLFIFAYF